MGLGSIAPLCILITRKLNGKTTDDVVVNLRNYVYSNELE